MKILHTAEFYHPSVGGMQEVVKHLSERLVKLGHEVTVATTKLPDRPEKVINGVMVREFAISGNTVRGMSGDIKEYANFLLNSDFDVITNFAAQQWATDIMLPLLERIKTKKVFVPTGFSGLYLPEYKEYFGSMKTWLHKYDMNIFLSENYRDIDFARSCGIKNLRFIPNGAGADEFLPHQGPNIRQALGIPQNHFLILHVGSHTGVKGHAEALEIFAQAKIGPATFLIIANCFAGGGCTELCRSYADKFNKSDHSKQYNKKILVHEMPRIDTVAAYQTADLFLFPSNIECSPLVLFEAMASRTPYLVTDVGNSAEIIKWSNSGWLLPTKMDSRGFSQALIPESARMLEDIFNNPALRETMKTQGYNAWKKQFTWEKITKAYEKVYLDLLRVVL